jgi:hypothetical protein
MRAHRGGSEILTHRSTDWEANADMASERPIPPQVIKPMRAPVEGYAPQAAPAQTSPELTPKNHTALQVAGLVSITALSIAGAVVGFAVGAVASEASTSMFYNVTMGATAGSMVGWAVGLLTYAVMKAN